LSVFLFLLHKAGTNLTTFEISAGISEQSMGGQEPSRMGFSCWPARLHRLAVSVSWNRFLGSIEVGNAASAVHDHRLHVKYLQKLVFKEIYRKRDVLSREVNHRGPESTVDIFAIGIFPLV
jgi:hypothetical protein